LLIEETAYPSLPRIKQPPSGTGRGLRNQQHCKSYCITADLGFACKVMPSAFITL
jgi:hypothetical protein